MVNASATGSAVGGGGLQINDMHSAAMWKTGSITFSNQFAVADT